MKIILLGVGSIGQRHLNNLRYLRPGVQVVMADPLFQDNFQSEENFSQWSYHDWRSALDAHGDADGAIIASPFEAHFDQVVALGEREIPFLVEKPVASVERTWWLEAMLETWTADHCAVGFNYRFWLDEETLAGWRADGELLFFAHDDLLARYGQTVLETMGSHSLDLALYTFGPARTVWLQSDGLYLSGSIEHERGLSHYDLRIDGRQDPDRVWRCSSITSFQADRKQTIVNVTMSNEPYLAEMQAWLNWLEGGERDPRLATLADGVRCLSVMAQCRITKNEQGV